MTNHIETVLHTKKFSSKILHGADTPERDVSVTLAGWARAHPKEAMAWVVEKNRDNSVRWKLLPIHQVSIRVTALEN